VHIGDEHGEELARRATANELVVTRFAVNDPEADVTARGIELGPDGTTFDLAACHGPAIPVRTPLVGPFNVVNALAAATTALLAGFELDAIVTGLAAPTVVPGRMERIDAGQDFTVFVDYAHTPDALEAAIAAARGVAGRTGRVIVVFGCGGDRDRAKRPVMGEIAARAADLAIVTSDNPRSEDPAAILIDVVRGVPRSRRVEQVLDRRAAICAAVAAADAGDVVLVAGKGHEPGQIVGDRVEPFDDRAVAREAIEARE
jgi:UDP-N-acetylmuramoyl-L-alanyl-D-glutamate--2,6-diaminopimelate ligase